MTNDHIPLRKLIWVSLFGVAFGFVESSVVVYLRAVYYPEGFTWPIKVMSNEHLTVEFLREAATIIMLAAIGIVAGKKGWQRFGYFLLAFGVWDIFYYVWLKVILNWPATLSDLDVLFLIPLPWIGPVVAPALIALLMVVCGVGIVARVALQQHFKPNLLSWMLAIVGTSVILYSFMYDVDATLHGKVPASYHYELLAVGLILYGAAYLQACKPPLKNLAS
jgi:hypothetical protein